MPFAHSLAVAMAVILAGSGPPPKKAPKKAPGKAPAGPEWLSWKPPWRAEAGKPAFAAVGRSEESGEPAAQASAAENEGRQHLGEAIAAWQEKCLRCAKQASETKVTASSVSGRGLLSFNIESATEVSLYSEHVDARAPEGKRSAVLLRQDLETLIGGIAFDASRPAALREAVKQCGQQSFDELTKAR